MNHSIVRRKKVPQEKKEMIQFPERVGLEKIEQGTLSGRIISFSDKDGNRALRVLLPNDMLLDFAKSVIFLLENDKNEGAEIDGHRKVVPETIVVKG